MGCATTLTPGVESTLRRISRLSVLWLSSTTTMGNALGTACQNKATIIATITKGIQDRKSTRLNSSHVRISYAVFCLKKKMPSNAPVRHHFCPYLFRGSVPPVSVYSFFPRGVWRFVHSTRVH